MIFLLWFAIWIITATSLSMLVLPALALITRGSYTQRKIVISWINILIASVVFLFVSITNPPDVAAVWGCRTLLFLLLFQHLLTTLKSSTIRLPSMQYDIAYLLHFILRSVRIVKERIQDINYSRKVRVQWETNRVLKCRNTIEANREVLKTITIEFVQLVTQFSDLISARGVTPHPKEWQSHVPFKSTLYLGDLVLLIALMGATLIPEARLVPELIIDLNTYLGNFFELSMANWR